MKERKIDHTLLAYILTLLNSPAGGTADPSQAYGMIRFMDEMPGGFLIYHASTPTKRCCVSANAIHWKNSER